MNSSDDREQRIQALKQSYRQREEFKALVRVLINTFTECVPNSTYSTNHHTAFIKPVEDLFYHSVQNVSPDSKNHLSPTDLNYLRVNLTVIRDSNPILWDKLPVEIKQIIEVESIKVWTQSQIESLLGFVMIEKHFHIAELKSKGLTLPSENQPQSSIPHQKTITPIQPTKLPETYSANRNLTKPISPVSVLSSLWGVIQIAAPIGGIIALFSQGYPYIGVSMIITCLLSSVVYGAINTPFAYLYTKHGIVLPAIISATLIPIAMFIASSEIIISIMDRDSSISLFLASYGILSCLSISLYKHEKASTGTISSVYVYTWIAVPIACIIYSLIRISM